MKQKIKALVFVSIIATCSITAIPTASAEGQKIRIATEGTWKPFSYQDAAGNLVGFEIDIVKAVCEKAKLDCEFVVIPFENIIPSLQENKIDAGASGFRASAKRKKIVDFVEAYYIQYPQFSTCQRKDLKDISATVLKGLTVGVQNSTTGFDYIKARYPDADLRGYKNVDDIWIDLKAGRIDLAFFNKPTTYDFLQSENGKDCVLIGDVIKDSEFYSDPTAMPIRKGDTATKEALDRGVKAIMADGTFDQINAKYWPFSIKYTGPAN